MKHYSSELKPYIILFLVIQTLIRVTLLARGYQDVVFTAGELVQIFARGFWFDICTVGFVVLPIALVHFFAPSSLWQGKKGIWVERGLRFLLLYVLIFTAVSEHIFWTEFTTRFNFIAVDYLVYTQEVIGNINESYPVLPIMTLIAILAAAITWFTTRNAIQPPVSAKPFRVRAKMFAAYLLACVVLNNMSHYVDTQFNDNTEAAELAGNGIYNLFYAFWNNEIDYNRFYVEYDKQRVSDHTRALLTEKKQRFENDHGITRIIKAQGPEKHKNVILVMMESLSADYMGTFGNKEGLTPNLDRLAKEGLLFSQTYATGTRTVRGLEAATLSLPPTPGQSIVRRPHNDNLFSLGFVFQDRGYDTKFIYGGYGYFDNMNEFFHGNGFDIVDRTNLSADEVHFANVWGVADDDLFARALKESDASYKAGKPFFHFIMTTSNHRPFTYPDGFIDIPSKSGRNGGVKYADYSVGKLMEWAKTKPWYKDTVFIFVADHTAGAGGKAELDPHKYHIPMIFYAPGIVKQGNYNKIASQIDLAPTLLGILNFSYRSKFYGENLLGKDAVTPRAFISNFQKVALVKEGAITILAPKREIDQLSWPDSVKLPLVNQALADDTVAYYQSASWWREVYRREPTVLTK